MRLTKWLFALCFVFISLSTFCQTTEQPFAAEIKAFAKQDSARPPRPGMVLFVGSSSIRLWNTLQQDFPAYQVLNRGFGGASLPDVALYAEQTIYRYQPSQIVFYCGENDFAGSDTIQVQTVVNRFTNLFREIRQRHPNVPFVFIAIKPSPSRARLMPKMEAANNQIRQFLSKQKKARFANIYPDMLDGAGKPRGELFKEDSLHMNGKGYAIWKAKLQPLLLKK
jgi:lysophospholipase L1-like esterase